MRRMKRSEVKRASNMDDRSSIERVPVKARELVQVEPDSPLWKVVDPAAAVRAYEGVGQAKAQGRIFKLVPPADADAQRVQQVRRALLEAGAVAVRVAPRASGTREVPGGSAVVLSKPKAPRQAVMELVDEARVEDREALREECELLLGRVGL